MESLTRYGSEVGGSKSFDFLHDQFQLPKCPVGYQDNFVDLEGRWAFYRH